MSGYTATVVLSFDTPVEADVISRALAPETVSEVARPRGPRGRTRIERDGEGGIIIRVESPDLVSLRAGLNSYLRWARTAEESFAVAQGAPTDAEQQME